MVVRPGRAEDLAPIAALIVRLNGLPEGRCLQCAVGETADEAAAEMAELRVQDRLAMTVADEGGVVRGFLACETDPASGRGWLRGPLVEDALWTAAAPDLYASLRALLPADIHRLDAFLDARNERALRFYDERGFRRVRFAHVYTADPSAAPAARPAAVTALADGQVPSFAALHESLFAEGGVAGRAIAAEVGDRRRVFVHAEGDRVLGYVDVSADPVTGEGFVDHLGVNAERRGAGLGRTLLLAALHWCFAEMGMRSVGLTVDDERAGARRLYDAAGFRLLYTGANSRWTA